MEEIIGSQSKDLLNFKAENFSPVHTSSTAHFGIKKLQFNQIINSCTETYVCQADYEIFIVKKGKGHFQFSTAAIDILDYTVYLLSPGLIYKIQLSEAIFGYTISFTEKALKYIQVFNRPIFSLHHSCSLFGSRPKVVEQLRLSI